GSLYCWGDNYRHQLGDGTNVSRPVMVPVAGGYSWLSVVASGDSTCAVRSDGTLWCWGLGPSTKGGMGTSAVPVRVGEDDDWSSVSGGTWGRDYACAIKKNGTLWCWGGERYESVEAVPGVPRSPVQVGSETGWTAVTEGAGQSCGLRADRTLWC